MEIENYCATLEILDGLEKAALALPYLLRTAAFIEEYCSRWEICIPDYSRWQINNMRYCWYYNIVKFSNDAYYSEKDPQKYREYQAIADEYQRKIDSLTDKNYTFTD